MDDTQTQLVTVTTPQEYKFDMNVQLNSRADQQNQAKMTGSSQAFKSHQKQIVSARKSDAMAQGISTSIGSL
jgi:hypothetical protein